MISTRGARAAEATLLRGLEPLVEAARVDPGLLAAPVRVVVPSASLREHVSAALVAHFGTAVAGVAVQTLHVLARSVLEAAGERAPVAELLFPILATRLARREPLLHEALDELWDGYAGVVGDVSDLLDAGFRGEVHAEAVDEALAEAPLSRPVRERARAVARLAARCERALAHWGRAHRAALLARAAERLREAPARLPARAVWVHGFADATGVASDLLEALVHACGARVLVDQPPDPADPDAEDAGAAFSARLRERLPVSLSPPPPRPEPAPPPPALAVLRAPGLQAEVRGVASRVMRLLSAGTRPESIGVVARRLEPYRLALRRHFGRLSIPFSSPRLLGPPAQTGRRVHALLDVLERGPATVAERWLQALAFLDGAARADLRLALHGLGAARLADVAKLDPPTLLCGAEALPLAARRGLAQRDEGGLRPRRRELRRVHLERTVAAARFTCEALPSTDASAGLTTHRARLERLLDRGLGWAADDPAGAAALGGAQEVADALPAALQLEHREWVAALRQVLREVGCDPLGGAGAGVQVLGVMEARGRCFDHLFVLGLNRDVFPRVVQDDPLLPDEARRALLPLLPDMPVKARGFEEEHHLFAQLLSSSPAVVLSWQSADDEGRARSPSPLLERLRLSGAAPEAERLASLQGEPTPGEPRPAHEALLLEALHGSPSGYAALLPLALAEQGHADVEPLAAARLAVLAEHEPDLRGRPALGPYFGFVGEGSGVDGARELYATHLETLVRCPWQFLLRRLLGLEPPPDALDSLPRLSPVLVGDVVHRTLEEIARRAGVPVGRGLDEVDPSEARSLPWPEPAPLEAQLQAAARQVLRDHGLGPPGFARLLAEHARPLVQAAATLGWPGPDGPLRALGAELVDAAEVDVGGSARRIAFRADRVDRLPDGRLRLVDYKTGRALSSSVDPSRRVAELRRRVAEGTQLQAPAYAYGADRDGRFLFLSARGGQPPHAVEAASSDAELARAFARTVAAACTALERGALFPRLTDPEGVRDRRACGWCEVREACLQGDSGARARLVAWIERGGADHPAESALRGLWQRSEGGPG